MKYAITGAAGHISKPLTKKLLKAGSLVTVIGRNENHLKELEIAGAHTAIGSVEDVEFLKKAFAGADAVYTMYPPNFAISSLKEYCEELAGNYAEAIKANGIKYVINLSSVGAHLPKGTGHISALYCVEGTLNTLGDVNIKHLRPVYFYTNLLSSIDMIKNMGIMGSNFSIAANRFPIVHPADIAAVAAQELLELNFSGHSVRYIASDETGTNEIAATIGEAIGKPDLKWILFSDEQARESMIQAGFPEEIANLFAEGFNALHNGKVMEDYWVHHPQLENIKLQDFAKEFAAVYKTEPLMEPSNNEK